MIQFTHEQAADYIERALEARRKQLDLTLGAFRLVRAHSKRRLVMPPHPFPMPVTPTWKDKHDAENGAQAPARAVSAYNVLRMMRQGEEELIDAGVVGPRKSVTQTFVAGLNFLARGPKKVEEAIGTLVDAAKWTAVKTIAKDRLDLAIAVLTERASEEQIAQRAAALQIAKKPEIGKPREEWAPLRQTRGPRWARKVQSRMPPGGH